MATKQAQLTLTDLGRQEQNTPIWVMNETKGDRRGIVIFSVGGGGSGRETSVTIHATFAPTCLTDQVARSRLLDSPEFKLAVSRDMLRLISEEYAQELLADDATRAEYDKVRTTSVNTITQDALNGVGTDPNAIGDVNNVGGEVRASAISNPVSQFIAMMDGMTDDEAYVTVRNMGVLTMIEYAALLKKARDLNYEKTGRYLSQAKKEL